MLYLSIALVAILVGIVALGVDMVRRNHKQAEADKRKIDTSMFRGTDEPGLPQVETARQEPVLDAEEASAFRRHFASDDLSALEESFRRSRNINPIGSDDAGNLKAAAQAAGPALDYPKSVSQAPEPAASPVAQYQPAAPEPDHEEEPISLFNPAPQLAPEEEVISLFPQVAPDQAQTFTQFAAAIDPATAFVPYDPPPEPVFAPAPEPVFYSAPEPEPEPEPAPAPAPLPPVLVCQAYGAGFGDKVVLADVDLEIPGLGITTLMGPVGTGKSTLLRSLAGVLNQSGLFKNWGSASFRGVPVGPGNRPLLVAQRIQLTQRSALESLTFHLREQMEQLPLDEQRDWARQWLTQAGAPEIIPMLDKPFMELDQLSQRIVTILREAAAESALLMIDEPTTGLSEADASVLLAMMQRLAEYAPLLVVLHNQKHARRISRKIVLLAGGRVQAECDTETFFDNPPNPVVAQFVATGSCAVALPGAVPEDLEADFAPPPPLTPAAMDTIKSEIRTALAPDPAPLPAPEPVFQSTLPEPVFETPPEPVVQNTPIYWTPTPEPAPEPVFQAPPQPLFQPAPLDAPAPWTPQPAPEPLSPAPYSQAPLSQAPFFQTAAFEAPPPPPPQQPVEPEKQTSWNQPQPEPQPVFQAPPQPVYWTPPPAPAPEPQPVLQAPPAAPIYQAPPPPAPAYQTSTYQAPPPPAPAPVSNVISASPPPSPPPPAAQIRSERAAITRYPGGSAGPRGFVWIEEGRLAATPMPGISTNVDYDLDLLKGVGVTVLISLTEKNFPQAPLGRHGLRNLHLPIADRKAPTAAETDLLVSQMREMLNNGEVLAVHCLAGLGRTGTILAAYLVKEKGLSAQVALNQIRRFNRQFVQSDDQEDFLVEYEVQQEQTVLMNRATDGAKF